MRVALAGASGLIGTALKNSLRARRARGEGPGPASDVRADGEDSWDPANGLLDPNFLADCDAVVCLSGVGVGDHRWTESYKQQIRQQPGRRDRHGRAAASPSTAARACWSARRRSATTATPATAPSTRPPRLATAFLAGRLRRLGGRRRAGPHGRRRGSRICAPGWCWRAAAACSTGWYRS